jgi:predicted nucleic acid-binding protein
MLLLDTNVLSAIMSARPPPQVAAWVAAQPIESLFTTTISQTEILSGVAIMRDGRRRRDLEAAARVMFMEDFEGRRLPLNAEVAVAYADLFGARRQVGQRPSSIS